MVGYGQMQWCNCCGDARADANLPDPYDGWLCTGCFNAHEWARLVGAMSHLQSWHGSGSSGSGSWSGSSDWRSPWVAASADSADDPQRNYNKANTTKQERESSWVAASAASADDPQHMADEEEEEEEEEGNVFMDVYSGDIFSVAYKHAEPVSELKKRFAQLPHLSQKFYRATLVLHLDGRRLADDDTVEQRNSHFERGLRDRHYYLPDRFLADECR